MNLKNRVQKGRNKVVVSLDHTSAIVKCEKKEIVSKPKPKITQYAQL